MIYFYKYIYIELINKTDNVLTFRIESVAILGELQKSG